LIHGLKRGDLAWRKLIHEKVRETNNL
ncbi:methylglyoxal synthase, partial [Robertmurraya sp. P23]